MKTNPDTFPQRDKTARHLDVYAVTNFLPAKKGLTFIALLCALSGCVTLPWETIVPSDVKIADTEGFKKYVEQVFRRQNKVTNQLIEIFEEKPDSIDEDTYDALEDAEEEMQDACVALNEIAAGKSQDEQIGLQLKYRALKTVGQCDRATKKAEDLVAQIDRIVAVPKATLIQR
ncbi:MAG: hypothetical protein V3V31_06830 [Methylococcales bacterium]